MCIFLKIQKRYASCLKNLKQIPLIQILFQLIIAWRGSTVKIKDIWKKIVEFCIWISSFFGYRPDRTLAEQLRMSKYSDLDIDLETTLECVGEYPEKVISRKNKIFRNQLPKFLVKIRIHRGFNKQFKSAWDEIEAAIQLKYESSNSLERILVTGHSLGGALAILCAKKIAKLNKSIKVDVITLGAPRVGDESFAASIKRCLETQQIQQFQRLCLGIVSLHLLTNSYLKLNL